MKHLRKIVTLMCALALMAVALCLPSLTEETPEVAFAGCTGTADDPWIIETAEQLDAVRYHLDASFSLTARLTCPATRTENPLATST